MKLCGAKVVAATVVVARGTSVVTCGASVVTGALVVVGTSVVVVVVVVVVVGSGMSGGAARLAGRNTASWKQHYSFNVKGYSSYNSRYGHG